MQIKTTLRLHLTLVKMAKIKSTDDNLCWRLWGKRNTSELQVGVQTGTSTLDINMAISHKIRKQPTSRPSNTTFWYIPQKCSIVP